MCLVQKSAMAEAFIIEKTGGRILDLYHKSTDVYNKCTDGVLGDIFGMVP